MPAREDTGQLVVIGASAGGIEALLEVLPTLPAGFPAPIVVAQHLDPARPSHLAEILAGHTALRVRTLADREPLPLEAGTIYVIPQDRHARVEAGQVALLADTTGRPKPSIDLLFSSAAAVCGEGLIAVILSGTGSDGASGARAVKQAGGTVVVQDPATASFAGMPRSLAPTTVDVAAPLDRVGPLLAALLAGQAVPAQPDEHRLLEAFLAEVRDRLGIDFARYKQPTILRRLQSRLVATRAESLAAYVEYVHAHPEEYQALAGAFLVKVTEFFRDPDLFAYLRTELLPQLMETAQNRGRPALRRPDDAL